ncbi:MAG: alpha/beta hydrolase [Thermoleophilia bacterium]|nr:alpha/beta hydrolase [Thermoleophilia bacterium]
MVTARVTTGDATIHAVHGGRGRPVVFLHAGVGDARMWAAQLPAVAAGHHAVAYDRPGFGSTTTPARAGHDADDLVAVLDALARKPPAVLVGCSQGGRVAIDAALAHPSRVAALLLISPAVSGAPELETPGAVGDLAHMIDAAEAAGDLDEVNSLEAHLWLDGPGEPEGRVGGATRDLFLRMNGAILRAAPAGDDPAPGDAWNRLGELRPPVHVLCGERDVPGVVERCEAIAARVPGARLRMLPGSAHLPSMDAPAATTEWILGALR